MTDLQSIAKIISFAEKRQVNIWQFSVQPTAQHVTVYAHCHHKLCTSLQLCVLGERTLPSYHRGMLWSIPRQSRGNDSNRLTSNRGREETTHPRKDCVPRKRGSFRHHTRCHADLWCEVCSWGEWKWKKHFWSARDMCHSWVLGAHDVLSARGMSFSDCKTTTSVIGSSQVWLVLFTILTTAIPTPDWSMGQHIEILKWLV